MSEKLGPIRYGEREEMMFLGRAISEYRNYSDKMAEVIDGEVHRVVDEAYKHCHRLLDEHWEKLALVADVLLDVETIDATQFNALMQGENPFENQENEPKLVVRPTVPERKPEPVEPQRHHGDLDLGNSLPAPA